METTFERAIAEHLELQARNSALDQRLPLAGYRSPAVDEQLVAARDPDSWWDGATTTWESVPAFAWATA